MASKIWWLSYSDENGCRGVVIVREASFEAAVRESHRLKLSPGGQVRGMDAPPEEEASLLPFVGRFFTEEQARELLAGKTVNEWEQEDGSVQMFLSDDQTLATQQKSRDRLMSLLNELANTDDWVLRAAFGELSPHEQERLKSWLGVAASTSSEKLLVGSVVQLASGGPRMTVVDRIEGKVSGVSASQTVCRCMWHWEGKLSEVMIPEAALKRLKEDDP